MRCFRIKQKNMVEEVLNDMIPEPMRTIYEIKSVKNHRELYEMGELRISGTSESCLNYLEKVGLFGIQN